MQLALVSMAAAGKPRSVIGESSDRINRSYFFSHPAILENYEIVSSSTS